MTDTRIDSLAERVHALNQLPSSQHVNRYTAPAVQLKKRLDILSASLTNSSYRSPRYLNPTDPFSLIINDYDIMMTDIYQHLSYLDTLDQYTHDVTNNRWYYCRKKSHTFQYLLSTYTPTPQSVYTMRDVAREWFFTKPSPNRLPLNAFLFNYLISLQDGTQKED